tara:strand:- start:28 stop:402 length:375 start_codon:yes stop_codon:yes gene_type:complete
MIKILTKGAIYAFIYANATIFTRVIIFAIIFFCLNIFYTKWENLLLITNPGSLFYLLIVYSFLIFILLLWVISSFTFFSTFSKAQKTVEIKKSIKERSNEYEKIRDVRLHPKLKSSSTKILEDE